MSAAKNAKSARARATIAIRQMLYQTWLGRLFDDCFEMGDGDAVVAIIIERAQVDAVLAASIRRRGFGYWLEEGYLKRMGGGQS